MSEEDLQNAANIILNINNILEQAQQTLRDAISAKNKSTENYLLAKDWAVKLPNKVTENGVDVDYSSKYYAQQAKEAEKMASEVKEIITEHLDGIKFMDNFRIVEGHLFQVMQEDE